MGKVGSEERLVNKYKNTVRNKLYYIIYNHIYILIFIDIIIFIYRNTYQYISIVTSTWNEHTSFIFLIFWVVKTVTKQ